VRTAPDGVRELVMMRWSFPPPINAAAALVTNVRNTSSHWWKPWIAKPEQRCLVPVTSFCEYDHATKPPTPTWFAQDDSRTLFFFAGIWRSWRGSRGSRYNPVVGEHLLFSFLTTEPNKVVEAIHPKAMPVLLLDEIARETWMRGTAEEALALQRPATVEALRIVATGKKGDP